MTRKPFHVIFVVAFLMLSSCSKTMLYSVPDDYKLTAANNKGVVIMSFTTINLEPYFNFWVNCRKIGSEEKFRIMGFGVGRNMGSKEAWGVNGVELDEGEYEILSWSAEKHWGNVEAKKNSPEKHSVKFTATAGKAIYAGNFKVVFKGSSYRIELDNKKQRDVKVITDSTPGINKEDVIVKLFRK